MEFAFGGVVFTPELPLQLSPRAAENARKQRLADDPVAAAAHPLLELAICHLAKRNRPRAQTKRLVLVCLAN